jgi:hypothetical protein
MTVVNLSKQGVEMNIQTTTVENSPAYNSWPMCQVLNDRIVCTYSRGEKHDIIEPSRAVYVRSSSDKGKTWGAETLVCNTPDCADVPIGKGLDENGNMLLWVRAGDKNCKYRHTLYRTSDGVNWEYVTESGLPDAVVQITDVLHVPGVGLMAFWFAGNYSGNPRNYWGKIVSADNGKTWQWEIIEDNLSIQEWVTEPSAVYLGNGRILIIARTECDQKTFVAGQFQITSTDNGKTWKKSRTNILDVFCSTPSVLYDAKSNMLYNYYYYRGHGLLNCRTADADFIFDNPAQWSEPVTVATGSLCPFDAGNVNATVLGSDHCLAWYSGEFPHTEILVSLVPQKTFQ